ncbi:glycosyltransferase family 2 protein [Chryseobacterium indologenes]|uniref:glycosyltransferase family 2 protein n=1 Tax=Chryseobacterium indologenes TaxID=253 RepID=UPI000787F0B0|nr:glycosyltransferase family 2 protein [Chryseobacterium indologenes]
MEKGKNNTAVERDTLDDGIHISVIIPVYNSAASLQKCVNSVLNQTFSNFELLLINDGSSDHSLEMMNSFAEKDRRVKVIDKIKNSGVSDTRNTGISHAKGRNICFIDSDDWIENNYLQIFVEQYESPAVLLIQNIIRGQPRDLLCKTYKMQTDFTELLVRNNLLYFGGPCAKFFEREIIVKHNLSFNKEVSYGEDLMFFMEYIKHVHFIKILDETLYHYEYTDGSLSRIKHSFASLFILHTAVRDFIAFQKRKDKAAKKYLYQFDWDFVESSIDQGIIGRDLKKEESDLYLDKIRKSIGTDHFLYTGYYRKVLFLLLKTRQFRLLLKLKRFLNT